jgi:VWFA-related protein
MILPKSSRTAGRWLGFVVFAIGVGVVVHAQTRQPSEQPEQSEASEQTDAAAKPVFRAGITLVTTDVIVRDGDGTFIPNLSPEEFLVKEDGVLQEVVSLVLVQGGRVFNQLTPPQAVQEGIILPPTRRSNDTAGRIIILFIDDLHLQTNLTPKARQVFRKITDNLIHEGDLFGIVSSGPSSLSIDMTYDRSIIPDVEERITGDGFSPREIIQTLATGSQGLTELRFRGHTAMETVYETLRNLEKVQNRRKVFIYLSSGYDYNPFEVARSYGFGLERGGRPDSSGLSPGSNALDMLDQGPMLNPFADANASVFSDTDLAIDVSELAKAANRANASFYTVDPRGLVAGPDLDFDLRAEGFNQYLFRTQNSLRQLAQMTGGKAIVNRNDFDDAAREIDAETSDYYVLGFYTNNPDPTARTRRLEITVDREDLDVQSRTEYTFARQTLDADAPQ